jgi:hypothetical protein
MVVSSPPTLPLRPRQSMTLMHATYPLPLRPHRPGSRCHPHRTRLHRAHRRNIGIAHQCDRNRVGRSDERDVTAGLTMWADRTSSSHDERRLDVSQPDLGSRYRCERAYDATRTRDATDRSRVAGEWHGLTCAPSICGVAHRVVSAT